MTPVKLQPKHELFSYYSSWSNTKPTWKQLHIVFFLFGISYTNIYESKDCRGRGWAFPQYHFHLSHRQLDIRQAIIAGSAVPYLMAFCDIWKILWQISNLKYQNQPKTFHCKKSLLDWNLFGTWIFNEVFPTL